MTNNIKMVDINSIAPYEKNARVNDEAVPKVAESIKQFGFLVPIVVDSKGVILAGHTRLRAAKSLGLKEVPVLVADNLSDVDAKAFRLADNKVAEISKWDNALLVEELNDLSALDCDMSVFGFDISELTKLRLSWSRTQKFCDLKKSFRYSSHVDFLATSLYATGKKGIPIDQIKENPANVPLFADNLADFLLTTLGQNLRQSNWCIVTAPRRRHKEGLHFATEICRTVSEKLHIPFYADAFSAKDRNRINPDFTMITDPLETNVIFYDDIITTGETVRACRNLLFEKGHTVFVVVSIKN